jgi:hypothetical protein
MAHFTILPDNIRNYARSFFDVKPRFQKQIPETGTSNPSDAIPPSMQPFVSIGGSLESKRAGLETSPATIHTDNGALARIVGVHQREHGRHGANAEEPLSGGEDHRKGQKPVFVNEESSRSGLRPGGRAPAWRRQASGK